MPYAPAFGEPPTLRALLTGAAPYGGTAYSDVYAALAHGWPALVSGNRAALLTSVGGSRPMAELLRSAWRAAAAAMDARAHARHDRPEAARLFHGQLLALWQELGRLLDLRRGVDIDFDWTHGLDDPLDDLRGRMAVLLAALGDREATDALAALVWQHARRASLGGDAGDLLAVAIGASLLEGASEIRWSEDSDLADVVAQWREHGRQVLGTSAPPRPKARPAPAEGSPLRRIEEARRQVDDGPSLIVLASVEHLPGGAKDGSKAVSGTGSTPRAELAPIAGQRLPLVVVRDLPGVKARLCAELPDAERIIDAILAPMAGRPFAWLSPVLLRGKPGSGKSRLARRIGEELGLAVTVVGCAAVADGMVIGTSRAWSTGRASTPLQAIRRAGSASVLIVLDEISRAGTRGDHGRLVDGVLALTERETARAFHDPYVECAVDLSAVSYIATANSTESLDPALLSRFRVLDVPLPTLAALPVLARGLVAEARRERGLDERWLPDLTPEELDLVATHWPGGSVRTLQALVGAALDGRDVGPAN